MTLQATLNALFASGHAVDLVIAVMTAEFVVTALASRDRKARLDLLFALLPGVLLLLALRAALTGAGFGWVAAFLAASFPIHLIDLIRRRIWRRRVWRRPVWSRHAP